MKKTMLTLLIVLILILMSACGADMEEKSIINSDFDYRQTSDYQKEDGTTVMSVAQSGGTDSTLYQMQIHFIDVGQGDCTFIDFGEFEALVDCGEREYSNKVINYISNYVDGPLDMVIATHPDSDHIGGIKDIFQNFDVLQMVDSGAVKDTATYRNCVDAVNSQPDCKLIYDDDITFTLGLGASIKIIETGDGNSDVNEDSVVCRVEYNDVSVLLTGDMGISTENKNLNKFTHATVLKAGHHGSRESSGRDFLNRVTPDYVVISVGAGNSYGHPHRESMQRFSDVGAIVYETMNDGTVVFSTDGSTYNFKTLGTLTVTEPEGSETYSVGSGVPGENDDTIYIGNRNSYKFHYSYCPSVNKMSEKNKVILNSREEAINLGFEPCGECRP